MKIVGEVPLLYGLDYLPYAVRSIAPFCDTVVILYTDKPSYGYPSPAPCPETETQLRACVDGIPNVVWHKGNWHNEGHHRNEIFRLFPDADLIVRADSDEVWWPEALEKAITFAEQSPARNFTAKGFRHFYRSFGYACEDVWGPVRLIRPRGTGDAVLDLDLSVAHFGYAIRPEIMRYKWSCHGHISELRPGWLENIWMKNVRENCHPTMGSTPGGWWNAMPFDRQTLPAILHGHPFFNKTIIE